MKSNLLKISFFLFLFVLLNPGVSFSGSLCSTKASTGFFRGMADGKTPVKPYFTCPKCTCGNDSTHYSVAGLCPVCKMKLVAVAGKVTIKKTIKTSVKKTQVSKT